MPGNDFTFVGLKFTKYRFRHFVILITLERPYKFQILKVSRPETTFDNLFTFVEIFYSDKT